MAITIAARLAHVTHEQDLLLRDVHPLIRPAAYHATVEFPNDQATDSAAIDAGRQIVCTICHLFEGVPSDHGIAIHQTELLSRTREPLMGMAEAWVRLEIDRDNPRHILWHGAAEIDFRQNGVRLARVAIKWMTLPRNIGEPMMPRHHDRYTAIAA